MRILLAANASYVPPRGGATRSNLVWLRELAKMGYQCRVVASSQVADPADRARQLAEEKVTVTAWDYRDVPGVEACRWGPLEIFSAADPATRVMLLRRQIEEFAPQWVLISSEDVGQPLLRQALATAPGKVVYLAHTPQFFPFGPESWNPSAEGTRLVKDTAAIVVIGKHMAGYVRQTLGREAVVVHPPIYGSGPFRRLGRFREGWVTMLNPCTVKGLPIYLELVRRNPSVPFAVIPGWGTTRADREALTRLPNVTFLPNRSNIEDLLAQINLLLMPSLWYEGFGLIVMEAMLRGIPVIASNSGGLEEAKQGTGYVIPVQPITRYEDRYDEHSMPIAVVPAQDIEPWQQALHLLRNDEQAYEEEATRSQLAAQRFVSAIRPTALGEFLRSLTVESIVALPRQTGPAAPRKADAASQLEALSPEKRALLLKKLRSRKDPAPSI